MIQSLLNYLVLELRIHVDIWSIIGKHHRESNLTSESKDQLFTE